jgi:hypothetical protein
MDNHHGPRVNRHIARNIEVFRAVGSGQKYVAVHLNIAVEFPRELVTARVGSQSAESVQRGNRRIPGIGHHSRSNITRAEDPRNGAIVGDCSLLQTGIAVETGNS